MIAIRSVRPYVPMAAFPLAASLGLALLLAPSPKAPRPDASALPMRDNTLDLVAPASSLGFARRLRTALHAACTSPNAIATQLRGLEAACLPDSP
jgi:hypothetical protein